MCAYFNYYCGVATSGESWTSYTIQSLTKYLDMHNLDCFSEIHAVMPQFRSIFSFSVQLYNNKTWAMQLMYCYLRYHMD